MSVVGEQRYMSEFLEALREEVDPEATLGIVVVLGMVVVFTDVSWSIFIAAGVAFGATTVISASEVLPGIKGRALSAALFAFGTLWGLWLTLAESSYIMVGFTVVVGWFALDALYDTVHGIERTEPQQSEIDGMSYGEANRVMYRAGQVQQTLRKSSTSLSVSELAARTELSEKEVREVLSVLDEAEAVLEHRERYELNEDQPGLIRSALGRFVRPFSLFTPSR